MEPEQARERLDVLEQELAESMREARREVNQIMRIETLEAGTVVEVGGRRHYRVMGMAEVETGQIEKIVVLRPVAFSDDYELYDPGTGWVEALYVPASFLRLPGVEIYKPST